MRNKPDYSPWGEIQSAEELYPGFSLVTTPGHGGIMVEYDAAALLSTAARKCSFMENGYLCFEEDCNEQVVLRELMDKKLWTPPDRIKDPAAFEASINKSIQMYHPEYWAARERAKEKAQRPRHHPSRPAPSR